MSAPLRRAQLGLTEDGGALLNQLGDTAAIRHDILAGAPLVSFRSAASLIGHDFGAAEHDPAFLDALSRDL